MKERFHKLFNLAWGAFHAFVMLYAFVLVLSSLLVPIHAQRSVVPPPTVQYDDLERRMGDLDKLNLDHRLTVIETTMADMLSNSTWYRISSGGTGLLLAEAVVRHAKKKLKEDEEG